MEKDLHHEEHKAEDNKLVCGNEKQEIMMEDDVESHLIEDMESKIKDGNDYMSHDQNDNNAEPSRLNLETPSSAADKEEIQFEESRKLFQELCDERDKALQQNRQLQMKLAEILSKRPKDHGQLETEQLQEYKKNIQILKDLRMQITAEEEMARTQEEELKFQSQQMLQRVEDEWEALLKLKRDAAVQTLSRHLGDEAAQIKVDKVLKAEQLRQKELTKLRLEFFMLEFRIGRLQEELREREERGLDPVQIQFECLRAQRLEQKKLAEKESEEVNKLQKKMSVCLEVLSHIKEKLSWSQKEVQTKREQLSKMEAAVASKREVLTRTKQARDNLKRDNVKLKERCGLAGNWQLLKDFDETVEASNQMEKQLEDLKSQQAEINVSSDRWRKKLEALFINEF